MYVADLVTGSLDIDAEKAGNEFRFLNDYRRIANKPNCKMFQQLDSVTKKQRYNAIYYITINNNRILLSPLSTIKKGDELLIDYGDSYWDEVDPDNNLLQNSKSSQSSDED